MNWSIKHAYLLLLTICLLHVWCDSCFVNSYYAHHHFEAQSECIGISSNHSEPTHNHVDNFICCESGLKCKFSINNFKISPEPNTTFKDHFVVKIWQPPKIA